MDGGGGNRRRVGLRRVIMLEVMHGVCVEGGFTVDINMCVRARGVDGQTRSPYVYVCVRVDRQARTVRR